MNVQVYPDAGRHDDEAALLDESARTHHTGAMKRLPAAWLAGLWLCAGAQGLLAQELEPRRWTHLPVGTNAAGVGYVFTDGDLKLDPALQIEEAEFQAHTVLASYNRYFGLLDRTARIEVQVPYQQGRWEGLLAGVPTSIRRDGLADPRLRLSVLLSGGPALEGAEFGEYLRANDTRTLVGAGLAIRVPLGEYMDDKLINLGENRYSFQPQVGVVQYLGPWSLELTASTFIPTTNDDFFGGNRLEQDPLHALQAHVVRTLDGGFWVSGGAAYGWGAEQEINGQGLDDDRRNLLYGGSVGFSLQATHSFRVGYIRQETFEDVGSDAHHLLVTWAILF